MISAMALSLAAWSCTSNVKSGQSSGLLIDDSSIDPGPSPMKRLTAYEINNVAADVFGDKSSPANEIPSDTTDDIYTTANASSAVTDSYLSTLERAASKIAKNSVQNQWSLIQPCDFSKKSEEFCVKDFIKNLAQRLYRRNVSTDEVNAYHAFYLAAPGDLTAGEDKRKLGHELLIKLFLQSPDFIYKYETSGSDTNGQKTQLSPWEIASRLSFFLLNSVPDTKLIQAVQNNQLGSLAQIQAQAQRLLQLPRAKVALRNFYSQWLGLDIISSSDKINVPAGFDWNEIRGLMKVEAETLLDHMIWKEKSLRGIFSTNYTFVNQKLATFYGYPGTFSSEFTKYTFDNSQRKGVFTLGAFAAAHSVVDRTSPTKRGSFVLDRLLCQDLPPFPRDIDAVLPTPAPGVVQTTRERFDFLQQTTGCSACHRLLDPIGFAFENIDTFGKWRTQEFGKSIDAASRLQMKAFQQSFNGPAQLNAIFENSDQFASCVPAQLFRFVSGRKTVASDANTISALKKSFIDSNYDFLNLVTQVVLSNAFTHRKEIK